VLRYVERTQQPLLADDATRDDRFANDPYLSKLDSCALLAVPIQTLNKLNALLLLENRDSRGAFGTNRLDTVRLIAGQLSVSLDNALLYADLERKVADRTRALRTANQQLERHRHHLEELVEQRTRRNWWATSCPWSRNRPGPSA
jgi:GAF domain-containing protein